MRLTLFEAILGHDLRHEIVLALEREQILRGDLIPLRADFLQNDLFGVGRGLKGLNII